MYIYTYMAIYIYIDIPVSVKTKEPLPTPLLQSCCAKAALQTNCVFFACSLQTRFAWECLYLQSFCGCTNATGNHTVIETTSANALSEISPRRVTERRPEDNHEQMHYFIKRPIKSSCWLSFFISLMKQFLLCMYIFSFSFMTGSRLSSALRFQ